MGQVKGLLQNEMPREKLIAFGPSNLTEVELLAIILRTGSKNRGVIELSRDIMQAYNEETVTRLDYENWLDFDGISRAKAYSIIAIFELSRRLSLKSEPESKIKLNKPEDIYNQVRIDFHNMTHESVIALFTDSKNQLIRKEHISKGGLNYSIVDPRILLKCALKHNASGIFLTHNHPSCDTTPSSEDINITKKIQKACKTLDVRFLNHLIISNNSYYSFC